MACCGGGGGTGRRGPQDPQETTPKAGERAVARRAFSDPGWTLAPDMRAAATPRSVCPCLPATTVCKRGRPASLGGPCPPAPRGRPPRRPHICPQTSLPSSLDALTPTLLIWLKMRGRGRKTPAVKRKRGSLHERARLLHGELWKTVFYYTNHSSPPLSLNSGGCEAAALSQAQPRLGHTLPY